MFKWIIALLLGFSLYAHADRRVGNGGGGIIVDGNVLTLPEAGVKVEGHLLIDVPSVNIVSTALVQLKLSPFLLKDMLPLLHPSPQRTYYQIDHLEPQAEAELKKIYSKLLNTEPEKVVIFAVTDSDSAKTFLLPQFFKLNSAQQASVLFHEWLWVANPQATYADIVYGEQLFYDFNQNPEENYQNLSTYLARMLNNPLLMLAPCFNRMENLTLKDIWPESLVQCLGQVSAEEPGKGNDKCLYEWLNSLSGLAQPTAIQKTIYRYFTYGGNMWLIYDSSMNQENWKDRPVRFRDTGSKPRLEFVDSKGNPGGVVFALRRN